MKKQGGREKKVYVKERTELRSRGTELHGTVKELPAVRHFQGPISGEGAGRLERN